MTMYNTPIEQISDGNGKPIVGAKKFLFNVGTTVKKTIYSDADLTIARDNPVLSDGDGRFPQFYLDGLYDEIQQDNSGTETGYDGVTIWGPLQVGEVPEGPLELWETDQTYNIPDIVLGSDDNYYRSLTDTNQGNNPVSSPGSWEQLQFGRVWNTNVTYAKGDAVYASDGYSYISIVASNSANNPISSPTQWRPNANVMQSSIAAGTVDAITATFPIPFTALNDQTVVTVRASGANATTTPTFAPDGLTAKTIVKNGNQAIVAGDIFGADHELILKYNSTNDVWELLNPSILKGLTASITELNQLTDTTNIKEIVILDTPEEIVSATLTSGAWTTVDSTTLSTAQASSAILSCSVDIQKASTTGVAGQIHLRKTGSALSNDNSTTAVYANSQAAAVATLDAKDAVQRVVNLDGSYDFDYYYNVTTGLASDSSAIYLVGYYV